MCLLMSNKIMLNVYDGNPRLFSRVIMNDLILAMIEVAFIKELKHLN